MLSMIKPLNFILMADGYKGNHWLEMPAEAKTAYVVCVPRKASKYAKQIVAAGHTFIAYMLSQIRITEEMIDEAEIEIEQQGYEFNRAGWENIVRNHGGRLPLAFYGVEEGRVVDPQTPIWGLINTDGNMPQPSAWLPGYLETWTQSLTWKMSTVASICRVLRITVKEYMEKTGATFFENGVNNLDYKVIYFGDRGADSPNEAAVLAGMSHAMLFDGSDCIRANGYIKKLYNTQMVATTSIEATEHSVTAMNSNIDEKDDFGAAEMVVRRLYRAVDRFKQGKGLPMISAVIDLFDSRRFVRDYLGTRLKDKILASGGKIICRPDSGDACVEPSMVGNDIKETFGGSVNAAGYYVLHPQTAVLQGDGINVYSAPAVLDGWVNAGYSMDSFSLGSGGGISHEGARDDFSFSVKAIAYSDGTNWFRLLKEPKTDLGKKSLSGLVRCKENEDGNLVVYDAMLNGEAYSFFNSAPGWKLYAEDGYRKYRPEFTDVRRRARAGV